jgi:hypothetical protein
LTALCLTIGVVSRGGGQFDPYEAPEFCGEEMDAGSKGSDSNSAKKVSTSTQKALRSSLKTQTVELELEAGEFGGGVGMQTAERVGM